MAKLVDANVILRHLLRDVEEQSAQARIIIAGGAFTTTEVLAEVVYVLQGVYKVPRGRIAEALTALLGEVLTDHADVMEKALAIYAARSLDFVDCVLIARALILGDDVFTFDKKLNAALQEQLEQK
ncbi:MAG: PIN domain-containing protein [Oscillospiraceae bacterium]|nr:PIN domain-containing protein [Oscillospiraceae bacterium]